MAKILVVDDSPDLLAVFPIIFKMRGFEVQAVSSKDKVIKALTDFEPDVILLDVRLSGEDGRVLCKEIKEKSAGNIAIILTSASPELLDDYKECKADGIIEKPFDIEELTKKVTEVLNKYQNHLEKNN